MTSRETVLRTLEFRQPDRVPHHMWALPWTEDHHPEDLRRLRQDFPDDIQYCDAVYKIPPKIQGTPFAVGDYVDEWGSRVVNILKGVIGEVKDPLIPADDYDWEEVGRIHIPNELLSFDVDVANRSCAESNNFMLASACPHPFEQLQLLRGTENLFMDLMDPPPKLLAFIDQMHDFYCRQLTAWCKTDIDGISFMDDWGTQKSLLISPAIWEAMFKPLYKDYIDIAHAAGKKAFMHSDGNILELFPHLIGLGLDAINSQLYCMGLDQVAKFKGQITFWGELDRQQLLPNGTEAEIEQAAKSMFDALWQGGGLIAHLEFGLGANPKNVHKFYETFGKMKV